MKNEFDFEPEDSEFEDFSDDLEEFEEFEQFDEAVEQPYEMNPERREALKSLASS